ncbi:MAG: hypothetical protein LBS84_06840, partial [Clostridiales bacterium]|nr:hypothetical protein [Clostridiales bacterium]
MGEIIISQMPLPFRKITTRLPHHSTLIHPLFLRLQKDLRRPKHKGEKMPRHPLLILTGVDLRDPTPIT